MRGTVWYFRKIAIVWQDTVCCCWVISSTCVYLLWTAFLPRTWKIIARSTGLTSHQTSSIPDQTPEFIFSLTNKSNVFLTGQWPPGHYCILASGACPAGFTRSQGHMRALKIYGPSAGYITQAKFGDSKIHCHGYCGQFGQWIGELYIAACCKWWSTQKSFFTRHKHPK